MPKKRKKDKNRSLDVPTEVAGVRIGKDLRGAIEPVLRFASHPLVADVLSAALLAGADTLARKTKGKNKSDAGKDSPIAAALGAATSTKGKGPMELLMAIAAGEIASRIVSAYGARPPAKAAQSHADDESAKARKKTGVEPRAKARKSASSAAAKRKT